MTDKVAKSLGYSADRSRHQSASCPKCGEELEFDVTRETAQTVERCPKCGYRKLHRGRLTTE